MSTSKETEPKVIPTMKKIEANDPEARSTDILSDNIQQLKGLFPEVFTEGKIDFDVLKQLLAGQVDDQDEKYGLNWHGKRQSRQLALTPSTGTLRPCPEDSVDWNTTQNLMIEGDNLEVLKLLQKSYAGKVKFIFIDPPYNSGRDFVYPDNYQDNIKNYLELTGQVEGGQKISSNTESSGRFHTDWLNMMYPRLKLARNLLRENGVIFISIDDNEADRLRIISDEVFGEENYLVTLYIQVRYSDKTLAEKNDYQKLIEQIHVYQHGNFVPNKESEDYTVDNFCWQIHELAKGTQEVIGGRQVTIFKEDEYRIEKVVSSIDALKETWATGSVLKVNASGKFFGDRLAPRKNQDGLGCLYKVSGIGEDGLGYRYFTGPKKESATKGKFYSGVPLERREQLGRGDAKKYKPILNWHDFSDSFGNCRHEGNVDFGAGKKPIALLQSLLTIGTNGTENALVMDFFAGSGSTGHAVWEMNQRDDGNRKFILVQLPEPSDIPGYKTIAEITKERLRRAGKKIKDENPMFAGDLGFRVFKLDSSNIHAWEPDRNDLPKTLDESVQHLKTDRTEADILYELLLKLGLDLCVPIEQKKIAGKTVHSIGAGVLLACLAEKITRADVEPLALGIVAWHKALAPAGDTACVFRDGAFADDVAKTNLAAILNQNGLTNVRSL